MKKSLRTLLFLMLGAGVAQAQFAPFNRVVDINFNRGASPANDTTANGVNTPSNKYYESPNPAVLTSIAGRFFPNITDGAYKLRALSYAPSAEFKLVGGVLSVKNATSGIAKVAAFGITNGDAIAKFKFTLDLTNYTAGSNAFIVAFGNVAVGSTLISSSAPFTTPQTDIFGAFRIITSGNLKTQYRNAAGDGQVNATLELIKVGVSQEVEVFVNSTAAASTYTHPSSASPISIPANTYQIYVNGVSYAQDFPKVGTTYAQTSINTISFTSAGSATVETVKISNLQVTYPAATLPVSLTSFTGKNEANGIRLNWKTASELNNDHFDILRSTEGQNFTTLTSVAGKGTSNQANTYSYFDSAPNVGTNYYKLKQVDKDGTATTSDIVVAVNSDLGKETAFTLNVNENTLNAAFSVVNNGNAVINVYDLSGRTVFTKSFVAQKGPNNISLVVPTFNTGIYVATLSQNGNIQGVKFVK
jgi:hypothetical protein